MLSDWSDHLAIDHAQIDRDHKGIVEAIEQLYRMSDSAYDFEEIEDKFFDLLDYMAIHFAREEGIMAETQYHGTEPHTREHDNLLSIYGTYFYEKNSRSEATRHQILEDLSMILIDHIKEFDRPLARHCQKIAASSIDGIGIADIGSRADATRILRYL